MTRGGSTSPAPRGGPSLGTGADQGAVLRLLGTLREEIESIRTKQAEIYEVVRSYQDQLRQLHATVTESLKGLPKSPYIAGQLVLAPRKKAGVDDFRELLATYLHGPTDDAEDEKPADVDLTPAPEPEPGPILDESADDDADEDEEDEEEGEDRHRHRRRGGGAPRSGPRPNDEDMRGLNRGPERDVEPFDLKPVARDEAREDASDDDDEPRAAGDRPAAPAGERGDREARGRRRGRRGRRRGGDRERSDRPGEGGGDRPRGDRPRGDRPERSGDRPRGDRPERSDRGGERGDRPERSDRGGERGDRPERSDRDRGDRGERGGGRDSERGDRGGRDSERGGRDSERGDRGGRDSERGGRDSDRSGERFDRHEHRDSAESSRFAAAVEAGGLSTASSGRLPVVNPPSEPASGSEGGASGHAPERAPEPPAGGEPPV